MAVKGAALAAAGAGAIFLWSGLFNQKVTLTIQQLVQGKKPVKGPEATPSGSAGGGIPSSGPFPPVGNVPGVNQANRALGRAMAAAYGWSTGDEWNSLDQLWTRESRWQNTIKNPSSTAYGIAQFLDSTWADYGPKTSNPVLQIKYGLKYIKDRYTDPNGAWAHEQSAGWY